MAQLSKLVAAFKACRGPFPWSDFERMIRLMGFGEVSTGATAGSRRRFIHRENRHKIICHEPHDGQMGPKFVRDERKKLEEAGLL
jgi:hypothetical protein